MRAFRARPCGENLHNLRQRAADFHGAAKMAADFKITGAAAEHAVELVHEKIDGFAAVIGENRRKHIGAVYFDAALGGEMFVNGLIGVAFEFHANAHNAFLMAKETVGFFLDIYFQGWSQLEMNTRDYEFMPRLGGVEFVVAFVHVAFVFFA